MEWITCQNIQSETWRRLLEFANTEFAFSQIELFHGKAKTTSVSQNYQKQASQIRAAMLQAKEYFSAATHSSLYTSPNHLYYGMVSLNTATMLMLGDGRKSLDFLRRDRKNLSHGLDFTTNCTERSARNGLEILENTHVRVCENGFFKNWYECLPKAGYIYGLAERSGDGTKNTTLEVTGSFEVVDFSDIKNQKESVLSTLKYIPDISKELHRYGVEVPSSRVTAKKSIQKNEEAYIWLIHSAASANSLEKILESFKLKGSDIDKVSVKISESNLSAIVRVNYTDKFRFHFPMSRKDLNNEEYLFADETGVHEIVEAFGSGFAFSMLSRYYPDIWTSCLESHCKASKLIEHIIGILLSKYPILALRMISGRDISMATQRPHWFS